MKVVKQGIPVKMYIGITAVLLYFFIGCSHFDTQQEEEPINLQSGGFAPPIYYDFGDVRLPEELKMDNKSSFVYKTPGFSAGVLVLEGNVERNSLIAFFESTMAKDNWIFVSSFKSPRTIMIFKKLNRRCVINITERQFVSTLVEIWVAPTVTADSTGTMD